MYYNLCVLSDFHFSKDENENKFIFNKLDLLVNAIKGHFSFLNKKIDLIIIVNGDIANTGSMDEYLIAKKFFNNLYEKLQAENIIIEYIFSPGNHDFQDDKMIIDHFENFNKFKSCFTAMKFQYTLDKYFELYESKIIYGKKVNFIVLNPYMECKSVEDFKNCKIDSKYIYDNLHATNNDINLVLSHIPDGWYNRSDTNNYDFLNNQSLVFYSHEHSKGVLKKIECLNKEKNIISLNCFAEKTRKNESGFAILTLNNENCFMKFYLYEYNPQDQIYKKSFMDNCQISKRIKLEKAYLDINEEKLNDFLNFDFIFFTNNKKATFEKLYIERTLKKDKLYIKENDSNDYYKLDDVINTYDNAIIFGEKESGKTTFAKNLFLKLYKYGKIPVYIKCKKVIVQEYLRQSLYKFIKEMFNVDKEFFIQNREKFVLILDDVEMNKENIALIKSNPLSINSNFIISAFFGIENADSLLSFEKFNLNSFGYTNRYELVTKWVDLEYSLLEISERNKLCKKICDLFIKMYQTKSLTNPKLLLIMLNSYKEEQNIKFDSSKIIYYEYIINKYILSIEEKLSINSSIVKDYYTELAYQKNKMKNSFSLKDFNSYFLQNYSLTQLDIKKLNKDSTLYECYKNEFKYDFIYAYFLSNYFVSNLDETKEEMLEIVHSQCFIPIYSSTVLFFLHRTKNKIILDECSQMADKLFKEVDEITFDEDIKILNSLVKDVNVSALNSNGDIRENNRSLFKKLDELNDIILTEEVKENDNKVLSKKEMELKLSYELEEIFSNYLCIVNKRIEKEKILEKIFHMGLRRASLCAKDVTRSFLVFLKDAMEKEDKEMMDNLETIFNLSISILTFQIEKIGIVISILNDEKVLRNIIKPCETNARNLIYMKSLLLLARDKSILDVDYLVKNKNEFKKRENHICFGTLFSDIYFEINYIGAYKDGLVRLLFQKLNSDVLSVKYQNPVEELNIRNRRKKVLSVHNRSKKSR